MSIGPFRFNGLRTITLLIEIFEEVIFTFVVCSQGKSTQESCPLLEVKGGVEIIYYVHLRPL